MSWIGRREDGYLERTGSRNWGQEAKHHGHMSASCVMKTPPVILHVLSRAIGIDDKRPDG